MQKTNNLTEAITYYCKILSLPLIKDIFIKEAEDAAKSKISYQQFLYNVLKIQADSRVDNSVKAKLKKAKFPFIKTIEEYDFSFQPEVDEKLIRELCNLNFMDDAKNIIFVGPPGVGKTHLAVGIGVRAALQRKRVLFFTAEELMTELIRANISAKIAEYVELLSRIDLIIIDELGYLEVNKSASSLFFKLVSKRYEKKSIILTTNKPFEEWGEIFGDDVVASAILDRLLHHSYPFLITGKSYRMKELFKKIERDKKD
ncbi:IstB domain protein ATP-binding protein [Thermodesulfobium narugense DSM 14796]|uniref:IstB domain protein ATP-binding protein n=1 Tax=Thermodesulfobium narugense DSM 14796 TaxID=747365 RepID=M1E7G3_9BACT|nr:IS21-like element helper ATPase IstB [Thermodesulfobium narugense]AEE14455.1 IstB domain protein ATP-binding protein [Thermodesulfobium narugense DSM 14796]